MLSDLESLEKRVPAAQKKAAQGDKESKIIASVLGQALDLLREGKPARLTQPRDEEEERVFRQAQLLTAVRRLAYDQSDRERREAPAAIDLDVPAPMTDPVVEGFEHNTAAEAFASLPERWRAVRRISPT